MSIRIYSRLLRLLPLAGGLTRLSFNRWTNRALASSSGLVSTRMLNGLRIAVDPSDHDGRVLYLFGTNDPKVHHVCQALLDAGDRFLDIGANYASIGLLAADRVGPTGQVHLFEPQRHLCAAVRAAAVEGRRSNVYLHEVALMDRDGEMELARPRNHSGMGTLVRYGDQRGWETVAVAVKDVATYVPPLIGSEPFGAKVDVELGEIYVLPWLLQQPTLKFIVFEGSHNQAQLWEMVRESRLQLYGLERTFFAKSLRRVDDSAQMRAYHDFVAVRLPCEGPRPQRIGSYALGRMIRSGAIKRRS